MNTRSISVLTKFKLYYLNLYSTSSPYIIRTVSTYELQLIFEIKLMRGFGTFRFILSEQLLWDFILYLLKHVCSRIGGSREICKCFLIFFFFFVYKDYIFRNIVSSSDYIIWTRIKSEIRMTYEKLVGSKKKF